MIDSTRSTVSKESEAERPKPTVPKTPSARRPRWTPTSTLSAPWFIAQPTTFCQRRGVTPAAGSATPSWSPSAWPRRSWASPPTAGSWPWLQKRLVHLFPDCPRQAGYWKRRRRLADAIEWLMASSQSRARASATSSCSATRRPVECARSRETVERSALGEVAGYGYCAAHSRFFWGLRLHAAVRPRRHSPGARAGRPSRDEREVALELLERGAARRRELLLCDKGYAGRDFARAARRAGRHGGAPERAGRDAAAGHTWRPSASASSRSSGRARTCSPWSATGRAPWRAAGARPATLLLPGGLHQPSTTGWGGPAGPWSTTAPEAVGVESII